MRKLKTFLSALAGGVSLSLLAVGSAAAASGGSVSGNVSENGSAASGISVTVTCTDTNNSTFTHHVTTSSTGHYATTFNNNDCVGGASVTVSATDGPNGGNASGTMGSNLSLTNLDFSLDAAALPEFKPLTYLAAAGLSVGALVLVRKKYATEDQA